MLEQTARPRHRVAAQLSRICALCHLLLLHLSPERDDGPLLSGPFLWQVVVEQLVVQHKDRITVELVGRQSCRTMRHLMQ